MKHQGLAHIAVLTEDMEKTIAFYELLGGTCTERTSVQKPTGVNQLAMTAQGGVLPHIAIEVTDLPAVAAELRAQGIDTFLTPEPVVLPELFGGLRNWFFTGPSGEQIELIEHFS